MSSAEAPQDGGRPTVARRMRATYAFAGGTTEFAHTVPPEAAEEVLLNGAMRLRRAGRLPRRATSGLRRGAVRLSWSDDAGGTTGTTLTGWTGRPALDTSLRDVGAVVAALATWFDPR